LQKQIAAAGQATKTATAEANSLRAKAAAAGKAHGSAAAQYKTADVALTVAKRREEAGRKSIAETNQLIQQAAQKTAATQTALKQSQAATKAITQPSASPALLSAANTPWAAQGSLVVFLGADGQVHLQDQQGNPRDHFAGLTGIRMLAFAGPDAVLMATASEVVCWEIYPAWKLARTIGNPDNPSLLADTVMAMDFSPDGALLATGSGVRSRTGQLKLWRVSNGSLVRALDTRHGDLIQDVRFSRDGKRLDTASTDHFLKEFSVATGQLLASHETKAPVFTADWSWDSRFQQTGDGLVRFLNHRYHYAQVNGRYVSIRNRNRQRGRHDQALSFTPANTNTAEPILAFAFSADNRHWAIARRDGRIGLHRMPQEKEPAQFGYLGQPLRLSVLEPPATNATLSKP